MATSRPSFNGYFGYISEDQRLQRLPVLPGTPNNDVRYTLSDTDAVIQHYRTKAATSWHAIQDVGEYALADEHDMIIEGYQIEPHLVYNWLTSTTNAFVRIIFLYREDGDAICESLQRSTAPNDWVRRNTHETTTFAKMATMIIDYSRYVREEAAKYDLPTCSMDGLFAQRVEAAIACLK